MRKNAYIFVERIYKYKWEKKIENSKNSIRLEFVADWLDSVLLPLLEVIATKEALLSFTTFQKHSFPSIYKWTRRINLSYKFIQWTTSSRHKTLMKVLVSTRERNNWLLLNVRRINRELNLIFWPFLFLSNMCDVGPLERASNQTSYFWIVVIVQHSIAM